jgi:two-component system chemotaxis response regulator CheB
MSTDEDIARVLAGRKTELLVIGGSAGGIDALLTLLPALPAGFTLPAVCILHLPPDRESRLAEVFAERVRLPVREAADKEPISPGTIYFAGPGYHLSVEPPQGGEEAFFSLSCEPPVQFARPAIDVLMESAADAYGPHLAGVLLTGANHDGAAGMERIHQAGGLTIVQDPAQAQASTMPEQAIRRCAPHLVLPLARIAALLPLLETT